MIERDPIIFDTETTGLGRRDQVVGISAVAVNGDVLLDRLVRPTRRALFNDRPVLSYNFDFDRRILRQSLEADKLPWPGQWCSCYSDPILDHCIMELYAAHCPLGPQGPQPYGGPLARGL